MMYIQRTYKFFTMSFLALFCVNALSMFDAQAKNIIDFYTFNQLSKTEQRKLITQGQYIYAHMEEFYVKKLRQKQKYTHIKTLIDLFINKAHAQDVIKALGNQRLCIYGGWVSYIRAGKCRHPLSYDPDEVDDLPEKQQEFLAENNELYSSINKVNDPKGHCETSSLSMVCNPRIFGTKLDGNPFCSVGNTNPYNSSFGCIKASQKYAKEKAKKDDSLSEDEVKNKVLDQLISEELGNNQENPNSLANMLMINYDVCMCGGKEGYINKIYSAKMAKQRTCFAWLFQTKEVLGRLKSHASCKILEAQPYQKSKANSSETIASMADWSGKVYGFINDEILDASNISSEFFPEDETDQWWVDNSSDLVFKPGTEDYKQNCPISFDEKLKATVAKVEDKPGYAIVTGEIVGLVDQPADGPWSHSYEHESSTDLQLKDDSLPKNQMYYKMLEDEEYQAYVDYEGFETAIVTIPMYKEEVKVGQCIIDQVETEKDTEAEDEVRKEEDETNKKEESAESASISFAVSISEEELEKAGLESLDLTKENIEINWDGAKALEDNKTQALYTPSDEVSEDVTISASIKNIDTGVSFTCSSVIAGNGEPTKENEDTENYKIKLEQNDQGDNTDIIATVTGDDGEITDLGSEGLSIRWEKGDIIEALEEEDDIGLAGEANKESIDTEEISTGTDTTINISKTQNEQKVIATLIKDDKDLRSDNETVDALDKVADKEEVEEDEKRKPTSFNPQTRQSQPQQMIRRNNGALRGIK